MPTFTNLAAAIRAIDRDVRARDRRLRRAVWKTAVATAKDVQTTTAPEAFGELIKSVFPLDRGNGRADVVADARHAAAVERGSRPHWPPLEPIVAWVKLRGMQGLTRGGNVRSYTSGWRRAANRGGVHVESLRAARHVALSLQKLQENRSTPVDAPTRVARAIQAAIARRGTRPRLYMERAMPFAEETLVHAVAEALPDR